jgi:hypothetical protein
MDKHAIGHALKPGYTGFGMGDTPIGRPGYRRLPPGKRACPQRYTALNKPPPRLIHHRTSQIVIVYGTYNFGVFQPKNNLTRSIYPIFLRRGTKRQKTSA